MRLNIIVIITLFLIISCEKTKNPENEDKFTLMDTLTLYVSGDFLDNDLEYSYDLNEDSIADIKFFIGEQLGGTYTFKYSYITGLNDSKIAYFQKYDTTWIYIATDPYYQDNDTSWYYHSFKQVLPLIIHDTIDARLNFSNEQLIIAEIDDPHTYDWPSDYYTFIDRNELIGEIFYIGIELDPGYAWLKIKALDYNKIVIYKFGYTNESNNLIIKE